MISYSVGSLPMSTLLHGEMPDKRSCRVLPNIRLIPSIQVSGDESLSSSQRKIVYLKVQ